MAKPADSMDLRQALTIATLLCEWELENCQPEASEWAYELQQARQVITQVINRPDPGAFFISPPIHRSAGRKSNQVIV